MDGDPPKEPREFTSCWRTMSERGVVWMGLGGPMLPLWVPIVLFDPARDAAMSHFPRFAAVLCSFLVVCGLGCVIAARFCAKDRLCIDAVAGTLSWNGRVYRREQVQLGPVIPDRWTGRRFELLLRGESPRTVQMIVSQWNDFQAVHAELRALVGSS